MAEKGGSRGMLLRLKLLEVSLEGGVVAFPGQVALCLGLLRGIELELVRVRQRADNKAGEPELRCPLVKRLRVRNLDEAHSLQLQTKNANHMKKKKKKGNEKRKKKGNLPIERHLH